VSTRWGAYMLLTCGPDPRQEGTRRTGEKGGWEGSYEWWWDQEEWEEMNTIYLYGFTMKSMR